MTKEEVELFLQEFRAKISANIGGVGIIIKRERTANLQTMLDLELTNVTVREHLKNLSYKDYYKGPAKDSNGGADLWEFGKKIKNKEIYIKITLGSFGKPVICISFHYPVRPIKYPLK
ncbi:toxin [Muricauda sp. HICW]|uniref:Toxin n=1 Tax=Flagellimonas chongwuensis TaxID=2697365 RepID=A0A850NG47_9FLAO|nr:type II toxin-antitoxin system MqsR family toxin [Allomuricauda chongwuensis]NVN18236.1 toxin [Allomuricauda chongwuensis]